MAELLTGTRSTLALGAPRPACLCCNGTWRGRSTLLIGDAARAAGVAALGVGHHRGGDVGRYRFAPLAGRASRNEDYPPARSLEWGPSVRRIEGVPALLDRGGEAARGHTDSG
ncbi:predicted protein [Streptomyces sp. SPB78]|nr:predicted protein [Streptomyces sp. SPB78]